MIILPQKTALSLMADLLDENRIESGNTRLQQLIAGGEAELVGQLVAKAESGENSKSESVEEFRYATEFDPPYLPDSSIRDPAVLKQWPLIGITPTGFETRNIGATIEITASSRGSGQWLRVDTVAQHVRFLRWAKTDAGKLVNGEHLYVDQPIFHTLKNTSNMILKNGQRILLGSHKVPDRPDQMELFLLRVEAKLAESK